ncbi:MAG TPA: hypothetical protein VM889_00405 [Candidatus Thermoplasmatota archaeon]|nr:hypothetical protein [Candidatus Thermoplasmatota archaeon]
MKALAVLVVLALVAGGALAASRASLTLAPEADEANRLALDATGQKNCVPEALGRSEDPVNCPMTATGFSSPLVGIRLLDAFPGHFGVNPWENVANAQGPGATETHQGFHSYARSSRGALPDLVYPGWTTFIALYGAWDDLDGDGLVDWIRNASASAPAGNEWASHRGGDLVSYISPGSHPTLLSEARPHDTEPDLAYAYDAWGYTSIGPTIYLDGTLLTTYEVDTVSRPVFAPGPHGRPFTPRADSLVDLDRYAALAPGPVEAVYGVTAGPFMERFGSPNSGTVFEDGERVGFPSAEGTLVAPVARAAFDRLYAGDLREWAAGSGSSAEGRHDAYKNAFLAWADLRLEQRVLDTNVGLGYQRFATPLVGRADDGSAATVPTLLATRVHTGLWRDLNGDGFVGFASTPDPYEGGSRPDPDDYQNPRGEFFPIPVGAPGAASSIVRVTLVPSPDWGEAGAFVTNNGVPAMTGSGGLVCPPEELQIRSCVDGPSRWHVTGATPITLTVFSGSSGTFGSYNHAHEILLPAGTDGFSIRACLAPETIAWSHGGEPHEETVWDCDTLAPLGGFTL